jgi:hypothetical protein
MHPFALSRADDPAHAIAAHSQDPHLAFGQRRHLPSSTAQSASS